MVQHKAPRASKDFLASSNVQILRRGQSPIVVVRLSKAGADESLALLNSLPIDGAHTDKDAFSNKISMRKCGAAMNSGAGEAASNGKNCDDSYQLVADNNYRNEDPKKLVLSAEGLRIWHDSVVRPTLEHVARHLNGEGDDLLLHRRPVGFSAERQNLAEMRILRYRGPTKEGEKVFHRHFDHGFFGLLVLASFGATADFFLRVGPGDERVIQLKHGDLLVFDASRDADVFHGVDAIHSDRANLLCPSSSSPSFSFFSSSSSSTSSFSDIKTILRQKVAVPGHRVSLQYRLVWPHKQERIRMAWVCRNLYSFEDHCFRQMVDLIGLGATVGVGTRLSKLQLLVNAVSGGCRNGGSDGRFHLLFEAVQGVCNRNPNSFLAGEMLWWGVGQTPRPQYECAWHIDKDVGNGAHCERIRVDLPITAAAKRAPFCNCRGSSSLKSVPRTSTKENKN